MIIPVHLTSEPCDIEKIKDLLEYRFKVIEDSSHAVSAQNLGQAAGSCEYSDLAVCSFHPIKIVTSVEVNATLTNCPEIDRKFIVLRSHGITRDSELMQYPFVAGWCYKLKRNGVRIQS